MEQSTAVSEMAFTDNSILKQIEEMFCKYRTELYFRTVGGTVMFIEQMKTQWITEGSGEKALVADEIIQKMRTLHEVKLP